MWEARIWTGGLLNHIHETGLRIKSKSIAETLERIFEADWALTEGENIYDEEIVDTDGDGIGDDLDPSPELATWEGSPGRDTGYIYLVSSPPELTPSGIPLAGEELLKLIGNAEKSIEVQVLQYSLKVYGKDEYWDVLDNALRDAAGRGVQVKLILSDWCKSKPKIDYLKDLSLVPNIEVKLSTIPQWSEDFISFARVEHCKYMVN